MPADRLEAMTLRLPEELRRDLDTLARAEGRSVAEEVREAITAHLAAKRKDDAVVERVRQLIDDHRTFLDDLGDGP